MVVSLALLLARVVPRAIPTELVDHRTLAHTALRCDEDEDTARKVVPRQKTSIGNCYTATLTRESEGPSECSLLYYHDSAAVRNSEGISEIFDCLMGVKQGCPLRATLFGLFVDGLEQHLMDTVGHDAPVGTLPLRRTDFTATIC